MKAALYLFLLAGSATALAQPALAPAPEKPMPADARRALHERLPERLGSKIAITGIDTAVTTDVKNVRDPEVRKRIEQDFEELLERRPISATNDFSALRMQQFEVTTNARTELYEIAVSNIPEDKIAEATKMSKAELLSEARKPFINVALAKLLSRSFPKQGRGTYMMLNPMTPDDSDTPAQSLAAISSFDSNTLRSTQSYPRKNFAVVGVLADISVLPYKQICSGTLIANNWFLTAMHCLRDPSTKTRIPPERLGVFFPFQEGTVTVRRSDGEESKHLALRMPNKSIFWFGEVKGRKFPISDGDMDDQVHEGNDIAVIGLAEPPHKKLIPDIQFPLNAGVSPPLTLAGYGLTNAANTMGELLLEVGMRTDLVFTNDTGVLLSTAEDKSLLPNGRICAGDSGGPVFLGKADGRAGNKFQLVAIASIVDAEVANLETCASAVQRFSRLDRKEVRSWLCEKTKTACTSP